jgi:hypothetical protein
MPARYKPAEAPPENPFLKGHAAGVAASRRHGALCKAQTILWGSTGGVLHWWLVCYDQV